MDKTHRDFNTNFCFASIKDAVRIYMEGGGPVWDTVRICVVRER